MCKLTYKQIYYIGIESFLLKDIYYIEDKFLKNSQYKKSFQHNYPHFLFYIDF